MRERAHKNAHCRSLDPKGWVSKLPRIGSTLSVLLLALIWMAPSAFAEPTVYTVRPGDTISDIAERFGMDEDALARANQMANPDLLQIGQKLRVEPGSSTTAGSTTPSGLRYVVQPGDNVSTIADRYGVSVRAIVRANGLLDADRVRDGDVLIVPDGQGRSASGSRGDRGPRFTWPLDGNITTYFGERDSYYVGGYHTGMDIAASVGDPVRAAASGRVVTAWKRPDNVGWHLIVDHGNGYASMYSHLSRFLVDVGDVVNQGQVIALAGDTGFSTGPHLHFEIRLNGQYQDPLDYLP